MIDDRLGAANVAEALAPAFKHLIGRLGMQTTNVDVGLAANVFKSSVERLQRRAGSRNGLRDGWLLVDEHVQAWRDAAVLGHLGQGHAIRSEDLSGRRRALCVHATGGAVDDGNARHLMEGVIAGV